MENKIIEALDLLCEKFGIAVDWTSENILPYAYELCLRYTHYIQVSVTLKIVLLLLLDGLIVYVFIKGFSTEQYRFSLREGVWSNWFTGTPTEYGDNNTIYETRTILTKSDKETFLLLIVSLAALSSILIVHWVNILVCSIFTPELLFIEEIMKGASC